MRSFALSSLLAFALGACVDFTAPGPTVGGPQLAISDAVHGSGNSGFYFLSPMVRNPTVSGTFDPNVNAAVRICAWTGTACGAELATFTRAPGSSGQVISVDPTVGAYMVRWFTRDFAVDPGQVYRIRVLGGIQELGFADVQVVLNNREARNVNTGEFIPLVDDHILNIRFRIEQGAMIAPRTTLYAGWQHACGLGASGSTYCWGNNNSGQLGNGTVIDALTPVLVSGGLQFASLGVSGGGQYYTCGLDATGKGYCWGYDEGNLGVGTFGSVTVPTPVSGNLTFGSLALGTGSSGELHTCGLTMSSVAYCWGANWFGQLGTALPADATPTPVAVNGGLTFASLTVGLDHTCGLVPTGVAYCWGSEGIGQLGNGIEGLGQTSSPVAVSGGLIFSALAAGAYRTCGLTPSGAAYCWGYNRYGQLGIGTMGDDDTQPHYSPAAVIGGIPFAFLTVGDSHTCGLTANGTAYCWGFNQWGQLGDGTHTSASSPVPVSGGHRFAALSAGYSHTCGITTSGAAYCWGENDYGELGIGTTVEATTPVPVSGGLAFRTQ